MGLSSSLLDESKSNFIKGQAQAELESFAPIYRKQYLLALLSHIHDEQVQRKEEHTQLLKQREPLPEADLLYMGKMLYCNDNRKWKQRFAVVRANYSLEWHESFESFEKGTPPLYQLLPTGGTIFTTEEKYMEMVDRCFPDTNSVKEDFAPSADNLPEDYPVYLQLPYRRDHYFCFQDENSQAEFISFLSDCIRHQNQDFLKKKSPEVKAFVKAVQLYRQSKGHYEEWDMLIGSDARVLANMTMESLLPSIGKDLMSRLKAKKTEKKRIWFATVEEMYYLVQQTLIEGMTTLKQECRDAAEKHNTLMRSDVDQIMSSRAFVEAKLRATVAEATSKYCAEQVEPHLPALLEEVMGPISLGFMEARNLSESMMEGLCQFYQDGVAEEVLQQAWEEMRSPNLQSCYEKVSGLRDHVQELQQHFKHPSSQRLEQRTQIDIEQLVKNVAYTFELFLCKAKENKSNIADAMMKAKHRVLKQYDYDSSTVRKSIFQKALLNITLPSVKAQLAPTFMKELPTFDQYIFADYVNFINVENIYEDILQQIVGDEINKVVNEAASMKKYNLFMDSRYQFSMVSLQSRAPRASSGSSSRASPSSALHRTKPASSLLGHGATKGNGMEEKVETVAMVPETRTVPRAEVDPLVNGTAVTPPKSVKEVVYTNTETVPVSIPTDLPVPSAFISTDLPDPTASIPTDLPVPAAFISTDLPVPSAFISTDLPVPSAFISTDLPVPAAFMSTDLPVPAAFISTDLPVPSAFISTDLPDPTASIPTDLPVPAAFISTDLPVPSAFISTDLPVPSAFISTDLPVPSAFISTDMPGSVHTEPIRTASTNTDLPGSGHTEPVQTPSISPDLPGPVYTEPVPTASILTNLPVPAAFLSTDPPGLGHTESTPTVTAQTLSNPVLRALESVANRMSSHSSSTVGTGSTRIHENSTSPIPASREAEIVTAPATVTAPPTGQEKKSNPAAQTNATVYPIHLAAPDNNNTDNKAMCEVEKVVDVSDPATGTMEVLPEPRQLSEPVIVKCEAVSDAQALLEACSSADSPAESLKHHHYSPAEGTAEPQPVSRPPDCIKEIRDLVVEVFEVEEIVQRYPDNGAT